jgi:lysocardiolipin and lysophospholipid acyltransferase
MEAKGDGITSKMDLAASTDTATSLSKSYAGKSPSLWEQAVRVLLFVVWFNTSCIAIVATQLLGVPLALYDKNIFYAYRSWKMLLISSYISNTKKSFGVTVTTITQWYVNNTLTRLTRRFAPTPIIISGDESVKDEIKGTRDGRVETHFAERIVFIANHLVRVVTPSSLI